MTTAGAVLHWYDLTCPFCYIGQSRSELFTEAGVAVVALPFQAHPDIPPGGVLAGPRQSPMYTMIDDEARDAGLPLHWPSRIPASRTALAAAEWVRRHHPESFEAVLRRLFAAHFVLGEDIADPAIIFGHVTAAGVDAAALRAALADGSADLAVGQSEQQARRAGVTGTPAWLVGAELIVGLRSPADFRRIIQRYTASAKTVAE